MEQWWMMLLLADLRDLMLLPIQRHCL